MIPRSWVLPNVASYRQNQYFHAGYSTANYSRVLQSLNPLLSCYHSRSGEAVDRKSEMYSFHQTNSKFQASLDSWPGGWHNCPLRSLLLLQLLFQTRNRVSMAGFVDGC